MAHSANRGPKVPRCSRPYFNFKYMRPFDRKDVYELVGYGTAAAVALAGAKYFDRTRVENYFFPKESAGK